MGGSNSHLDSDLDPRYNIERNSKNCDTNFQRLQYHGVRYPKGKMGISVYFDLCTKLSITTQINGSSV
jgi:hypothetical protein